MAERELARAKVNLALHVVGRRADGYHELDMLVAFPPIGDILEAELAGDISLHVSGPGAVALGNTPDNLVLKAAHSLADLIVADGRPRPGASVRLDKQLPIASGIGGGSADAAAALRLLCRLWSIDVDHPEIMRIAGRLGADVPMCLHSVPLRARGIGDEIDLIPALPPMGILLVNPGKPVSTPAVFRGLTRRDFPPLDLPDRLDHAESLIACLAANRNDMQPVAEQIEPAITEVIASLRRLPGCRLARMSGSGATCFALFATKIAAESAAAQLAARIRAWWIRCSELS